MYDTEFEQLRSALAFAVAHGWQWKPAPAFDDTRRDAPTIPAPAPERAS